MVYDAKALAIEKFESHYDRNIPLDKLYSRCVNEKKLCNNLVFEVDEQANPDFPLYKQFNSKTRHDAGFNAYMTGHIFGSLTKWLEIGQILDDLPSGKSPVSKGTPHGNVPTNPDVIHQIGSGCQSGKISVKSSCNGTPGKRSAGKK